MLNNQILDYLITLLYISRTEAKVQFILYIHKNISQKLNVSQNKIED